MQAHLAAIGCNGQEISRAHLAAIGCNGLKRIWYMVDLLNGEEKTRRKNESGGRIPEFLHCSVIYSN